MSKRALKGTGIVLEFEDRGCTDKATELLAGIEGAADRAINSAVKRTGQSAKAFATRKIRDEYLINSGDFKKYTHYKTVYKYNKGSQYIIMNFYGSQIPLIKFDTKIGKDGSVSARVKKSSKSTVFKHAFFSDRIGARAGIFERETKDRKPTKELLGPAVPQMLSYNENLKIEIVEKIYNTFEERLEHEILTFMNGWRI